jgi:hypothetical protein
MGLVDRAKNIILTPKTEWDVVATEEPNPSNIILGYALPLALIPAAAMVVGMLIFGGGFGLAFGIAMAVVGLIVSILSLLLAAAVVSALAPSFNSEKNFGRALQVVTYSYTPAWVAGILSIFPPLAVIMYLGWIYGIYLMYLGLSPVLKTPEDKRVVYLLVAWAVIIVIYFILMAILGAIVMGIVGFGAAATFGDY